MSWNRTFEDREHRKRRVKLIRENPNLTHNDIDKLFAEEKALAIAETLRLTEVEKLTVEKEELEGQIAELEDSITVLMNREKFEKLKELNDMREVELYETYQRCISNFEDYAEKYRKHFEHYQGLIGALENAKSWLKLRHSNYEHAKKESIEEIRKILNAPKMKKIPDKQVRALHLSFFAESLGKAVEHAQKCANDVQSFIPSIKGAKEQLLDAMQKVEELKPKVEKLAKLRLTEL